MLYVSNPITVNIVTAQSSLLQKHPEPAPTAYLLGAYWFVKVQSDSVKCLARRQGIDLLRGSGFGKLLGATGDTSPSATEGLLLSGYTQGSRNSKGQTWGDL